MNQEIFDEDLRECQAVLKAGGIILYPTDTVWGIGCDATNAEAIEKIYKLKQRAESKSMLILVDKDARVERHYHDVPEVAWDLFEYTTKPTTLILENAYGVADNLIAKDGTLGVRVVKNLFCQRLINRMNRPLVSTSANISGQPTPMTFDEISQEIIDGVDYVVRVDRKPKGGASPSTIIKLGSAGKFEFIRK